MKQCLRCENNKPVTDFHPNNRKCKTCVYELQKARRATPEGRAKHLEYKRRARLKARYGISAEQYSEMLLAQNGLCAICSKPPKGRYPLVVDHDHATGAVRQLLCNNCNVLLGMAKDNVLILQAAIEYLTGGEVIK